MSKPIKVIDLFAGPGGLGEGFSAHKSTFKLAISIEKERSAHQTLLLRAFIRQFDSPPPEYYQFLKGELGKDPEAQLYKLSKYKREVSAARNEARCLTLGEDDTIIFEAIDNAIGKDECILIGGPPCQAYSLAGRSRNAGIVDYDAKNDHRNFLYREYLAVIARYQPKIFVMENVKGMLSAKIDGNPIFDNIRNDLHNPCEAIGKPPQKGRKVQGYKIFSLSRYSEHEKLNGYDENRNPKDYVIHSEEYGIPQKRHRVILLGIREDLADNWNKDCLLKPSPKVILKDIIGDLPPLRSGLSKKENSADNWKSEIITGAIQTKSKALNPVQKKVSNEMLKISEALSTPTRGQGKCLGLKKTTGTTSKKRNKLSAWYEDKNLKGWITNHESRNHMGTDLWRYLFCSTWAKLSESEPDINSFPRSQDYPNILKPKHSSFDSGKFADRFRVQVANEPATTVTSHISKDGHYYIHYDPKQCRSITVREAARIQTFPDNYFFVGNRTQQYVQVGNAVPPYLAFQIASVIKKLLSVV